jgi:hypothetical protein
MGVGHLSSPPVELRFADGELASLCRSAERLRQRWGPELAPALARQLLLLQAVPDVAALSTLPNFRPVAGTTHDWLATVHKRLRISLRLQEVSLQGSSPAVRGIGGSAMLIVRRIEELEMANAQ